MCWYCRGMDQCNGGVDDNRLLWCRTATVVVVDDDDDEDDVVDGVF